MFVPTVVRDRKIRARSNTKGICMPNINSNRRILWRFSERGSSTSTNFQMHMPNAYEHTHRYLTIDFQLEGGSCRVDLPISPDIAKFEILPLSQC